MNQDSPSLTPVSVVIPTRDRVDLLLECLESLVHQTHPPLEVIVVDDASNPYARSRLVDGVERVKELINVSLILQSRRGPNGARNRGISEASGNVLALLDDDAVTPETWLEKITEALSRYPGLNCVGGPLRPRYLGRLPRHCGREPKEASFDVGAEEQVTDHVLSANMAFTRDTFDTVGPFNEDVRIGGDETEWEVRLQRRGGSVVYVPSAWVIHQRTAEDLSIRRLVQSKFRRGQNFAANASYFGQRVSVFGGIARLLGPLGHAIRFFCWGGILDFIFRLGAVCETVTRLLAHDAKNLGWFPRRPDKR